MPGIQELMGVPSFGGQLGRALGGGISEGISKQLESFHRGNAFEQAGLPRALATLDPTIATQLIKQQQKNALIQEILGQGQESPQLNQGNLEADLPDQSNIAARRPNISQQGLNLSPQQRIKLSAADPNIGRAIQAEEKFKQAEISDIRKSDIKRSDKYLDQINENRSSTQRARTSLNSAEEALSTQDLGFFSRDYFANLTGIPGLSSPEGAVFNAAAKNFFLADLQSAVGRPNQFLEKILKNAVFDVGKTNEANAALIDFYKNQVDIEEEKIKISDNLEDYYRKELGYVPGNIGRLVDAQLKPYALEKEKELVNKFKESELSGKGEKLTQDIAKEILGQAKGDKELARKIAKKRGYKL